MTLNERDSDFSSCTKLPNARVRLLKAALQAFHTQGFHRATVAHIREQAGVSNGSFFHCFASKEALAAQLYLDALDDYHAHMVAELADQPSAAAGIATFIFAHASWVMTHRAAARFLFEQAQADWLTQVREQQQAGNTEFRSALGAWQRQHAEDWLPMPMPLVLAQLVAPVQYMCRRWLNEPATHAQAQQAAPLSEEQTAQLDELVACAQRALLRAV